MTEEFENLFKNLLPKERDVIILLFGLNGFQKSPEEIGALYCVDKNEILQIVEQALTKLPISIEELKSMGEKAAEELKNRMAVKKPHRTLSDTDSELLNINFF